MQTRHTLLSSPLIPDILNKSPSSAFRPALSNLWLLLVYIYFLIFIFPFFSRLIKEEVEDMALTSDENYNQESVLLAFCLIETSTIALYSLV